MRLLCYAAVRRIAYHGPDGLVEGLALLMARGEAGPLNDRRLLALEVGSLLLGMVFLLSELVYWLEIGFSQVIKHSQVM